MSAITVENLGKRYVISHQLRQDTLRDSIMEGLRNMTAGLRGESRPDKEDFWALDDVSFSVEPGEVVGIIGRNGAGKSTLLKVLSRITEPTRGRISMKGRVASLLEVGTGFHPELSGRENIFLNGAILGMAKAEIVNKFDQIVDFAGVEQFLDTPVKRYSSGMYVRLAFAVAAHLDSEILIVDEVLAVGDHAFQKKCLGKMRDVAHQSGRTVLLVSHNLGQIAALANRCVVLENGRVKFTGDTQEAIPIYYGHADAGQKQWTVPNPPAGPHLKRVRIQTSDPGNIQAYHKPLEFEFELAHAGGVPDACFSFQIINASGTAVAHLWRYSAEGSFAALSGSTVLRCEIPQVKLNVGLYSLRTYFSGPPGSSFNQMVEPELNFEVVRLDKPVAFGWRSDACTYFEDATWKLSST